MAKKLESKPLKRLGILSAVLLIMLSVMYTLINNNFFSSLVNLRGNTGYFVYASASPARIRISKINVDARVEHVGLTRDGAMDVPKQKENTGWLKTGPRPGERGSSVIAGHRGWRSGRAVFDDLHLLKKGDKIYVEDATGKSFVFEVREMRSYDARAKVSEVWQRGDKAYLNLITCFGDWNEITRTSAERLVVFAELVE